MLNLMRITSEPAQEIPVFPVITTFHSTVRSEDCGDLGPQPGTINWGISLGLNAECTYRVEPAAIAVIRITAQILTDNLAIIKEVMTINGNSPDK